MGFFDRFKDKKLIVEKTEAFKPKIKEKFPPTDTGEGADILAALAMFDNIGLSSFNLFYNTYINQHFKNNIHRMRSYREMAVATEISDVIEDAANESVQTDEDGNVVHLEIKDQNLNENMVNNIQNSFYELFYKRLNLVDLLWDMFYTYMVDGKVFYERVIDTKHKKNGIVNLKKLPTTTMDVIIDPLTNKIKNYLQYLSERPGSFVTIEQAEADPKIVVFYPDQIGYINYGLFGQTQMDTIGYLEKAKVPFNQLKLLETSVIIYRIVRAPERLVFRIDTGNMPKDKSLAYVEKIKSKMTRKQTYDTKTGQLTSSPEIMSMLENYYVPQSADGRGSSIDTVGGDSKGFTELDDIYYFSRKLYRALKYPISRVTAEQENRGADIVFGGSNTGEISRDEIKWARFLERQQDKFTKNLEETFLIHLDFTGLKKQYNLTNKSFKIRMNPPSKYKEQMEQNFLESRYNNYMALADRDEISRVFLMKRFLKWSDDEIKENVKELKNDYELGFRIKEEM